MVAIVDFQDGRLLNLYSLISKVLLIALLGSSDSQVRIVISKDFFVESANYASFLILIVWEIRKIMFIGPKNLCFEQKMITLTSLKPEI